MKLTSRLILGVCIAAVTTMGAFADYTPSRPEIVSSRLNSMGGANPALIGRGVDSLSTNPASFAFEEKAARAVGIDATFSGFSDAISIFSIANNANNLDPSEAAGELKTAIKNNDGLYVDGNVAGPISFAYVAKNFGIGVFNRTYASVDAPSVDSNGSISAGEEILITGGYGFKVIETELHELAVGIQGKLFFQLEAGQSDDLQSLVTMLSDFDINDLPSNSGLGVGIDLGVLYRFNIGNMLPSFLGSLSAGVVCRDVYTPVFCTSYDSILNNGSYSGCETLDPDLQIGIAWQPVLPTDFLKAIISDITVSFGMSDLLFTSGRNPALNISVGAEAVFFNILSIRAGLNEICPAVGVGVDFGPLQFDFAFYGRELGDNIGERTVYNLALGLGFGF